MLDQFYLILILTCSDCPSVLLPLDSVSCWPHTGALDAENVPASVPFFVDTTRPNPSCQDKNP